MDVAEIADTVPLRRVEYEALVEQGLLEEEPVELLGGRKVPRLTESAAHAAVVDDLVEQLRGPARGAGLAVRVGHPVALSDIDEPEPDVAVVTHRDDHYRSGHPGVPDLQLVVEVASRSLQRDLGEKARRYAAAGVSEYWVVDLTGRRTVVHREPDPDAGRYRSVRAVPFGTELATLALPETTVVAR